MKHLFSFGGSNTQTQRNRGDCVIHKRSLWSDLHHITRIMMALFICIPIVSQASGTRITGGGNWLVDYLGTQYNSTVSVSVHCKSDTDCIGPGGALEDYTAKGQLTYINHRSGEVSHANIDCARVFGDDQNYAFVSGTFKNGDLAGQNVGFGLIDNGNPGNGETDHRTLLFFDLGGFDCSTPVPDDALLSLIAATLESGNVKIVPAK